MFDPQYSPHDCTVHKCVVSFEEKKWYGQMQPMGFQTPIQNLSYTVFENDTDKRISRKFWRDFVRPSIPFHSKNYFLVSDMWNDDSLIEKNVGSHFAIVEENNRIIDDHRKPYWTDWNISLFVKRYMKRQWHNQLYCITPLDQQFNNYIPNLNIFKCPEMKNSIKHTRLWMSAGNTTSSLHFDTHDVVVMQMYGVKEWFLYEPNIAHHTYMDHHTRYGLSPINTHRVDLRKFPKFGEVVPKRVELKAGDILFVPAMWWHIVSTPRGKNIGVTYEFEYNMRTARIDKRSKSDALIAAHNYLKINRNKNIMC